MADPNPPDRKPLLSLSTFVDRATITIDDRTYEIRNGEEFAPIQYAQLTRVGRRMQEIETEGETLATGTLEKLSDAAAIEYDELHDRLCRLALIAPPEVHDKLTYLQRKAVVTLFLGRSHGTSPNGASATSETRNGTRLATGAKPSPGSRGSIQGSRRTRG